MKRPKELKAVAIPFTSNGKKYSAFIGLVDDKPFELFVYNGTTTKGNGKLLKESGGKYYFIGDDSDRKRLITDKMTPEQEFITRSISGLLQRGEHPKYIIEKIEKSGTGIFDWLHGLKRVLGKFVTDGESLGKTCPVCKQENALEFKEGCVSCKYCGYSKC